MTEKPKTWEYQGKNFKKCPQCTKAILAEWTSHLCGWGKTELIKVESPITEVKTADNISELDTRISQEVMKLEKIINIIENDTKLYALFSSDKSTLWQIIRDIYIGV